MNFSKMSTNEFMRGVSLAYFVVMRDAARDFDNLINSAKNKIGIAHKYANIITKKVWAGDWSVGQYDIDTEYYFLGAKAYEFEIADKLRALIDKGELKGFPLEKYTG